MGKRVAVIGGGWIGVYATKWMKQFGFEVTAYEKEAELGGVWVYREDVPGGVFKYTHSTSSKSFMHACDYPMDESWAHFPNRKTILEYIINYANDHQVTPCYHFNTKVVKMVKKDADWYLDIETKGEEPQRGIRYDHVIIATGITTPKSPMNEAPFTSFTGKMMHSETYKDPDDGSYAGKKVLIIGGGESATDIAHEIGRVTDRCILAIRSGMWVHDRDIGGAVPADLLGNRSVWGPGYYKSSLLECARFVLEYFWGRGGSGVKDWEPTDRPYMRSFINKSRDVMRSVVRGLVIPRRGISKIDGKMVTFTGYEDQPEEIDLIIFCTGFKPTYPYYDDAVDCPGKLFHYVFDPRDTSMAYVGTARPIFGSFPSLAEMQIRWVGHVWSGKVQLPGPEAMVEEIGEMNREHHIIFPEDHKNRPNLVNHYEYTERIASFFGANPNLLKEYVQDPMNFWQIMSRSWNPFQYLVVEDSQRKVAYQRINDEYPKNHAIFDVMYYGVYLHFIGVQVGVVIFVLFLLYSLFSILY